ncbi:iron-containing alcohol dehydrogenase [Candidatus Sumerlaeota bacterium]|nr:iron-containing alcohol dehydrogenase [Candidatus Sumerlaeota bacterium]
MRFEFATATRIVFGPGTFEEVGPLGVEMGRRALLVIGCGTQQVVPLMEDLNRRRVECITLEVTGEPTTQLALAGVSRARETRCDFVVAVGGGSAIDTAKAVAAMLTNEGDLLDYLEVIGKGKQIANPPAPFIAVPTTAGTGAEVTRNAVLGSLEHRVKVSMRSPLMLPRLVVVDPLLTHSVPPAVTASTGLDALTQVIEPYVSIKANPLVDGICREGMARAARSLLRAYRNGSDAEAREDMSLASLFGGLALANAGLGAVHGFAGPIGGMFPAPHGVVCARLLPHVVRANVEALTEREPDSPVLARYDEVARIVTGAATARAIDAVEWVRDLCAQLKVPPLSEYGIRPEHFPEIVENSQKASSMKGNPIVLTPDELSEILRRAV